jgi:hypothetical protein
LWHIYQTGRAAEAEFLKAWAFFDFPIKALLHTFLS